VEEEEHGGAIASSLDTGLNVDEAVLNIMDSLRGVK
jgi:hypothetical protein